MHDFFFVGGGTWGAPRICGVGHVPAGPPPVATPLTLPSFNKIQKTFLVYINAEKKLATTRGKLGEHLLKWEYVQP